MFNWDQKPDYISKTNADKSIFGIEKVDDSCDSVFIFEGPFDSFFVNNGIAVAGITKRGHSFTPLQEEQLNSLKSYKKIWCLDSQWKDQTAREKSEALLNAGESVFIWPEKYGTQFKDLNEMCIKYKLNEVSPKFIKDNTFIGMAGVFRLRKMGKIL